jgi:hypothetical protein
MGLSPSDLADKAHARGAIDGGVPQSNSRPLTQTFPV